MLVPSWGGACWTLSTLVIVPPQEGNSRIILIILRMWRKTVSGKFNDFHVWQLNTHIALLLCSYRVRFCRIWRIQVELEGTKPKTATGYIPMDIRLYRASQELALGFMHLSIHENVPCGASTLDQRQIDSIISQLAAARVPCFSSPDHVLQIISYHGGVPRQGLTWPPDQAGRDDNARLVEAFEPTFVPPSAPPGCKHARLVMWSPQYLGNYESTIIKCGKTVAPINMNAFQVHGRRLTCLLVM